MYVMFFKFFLIIFLFLFMTPFCKLKALGSHGNSAVEVDRETSDKMGRIQGSYQQNREAVLNNLLKMVCDIKPEIHANYRVAG